MRTLYIAWCLALAVMSQARHIPADMRRYVGTGLFLGKMNGLSPNNTYSDSEAVSTTPDENVASETTTMETSSDVTPTIILAATSSFDDTESSDVTTIGSAIVNDFQATIEPTLTPESGSVNGNAVDGEIIGKASADLDGQTKASAGIAVDYEGTTSFSVDWDGNQSFGTTDGEIRGDASVGLDGITTVGVVEADLAIDSSTLVTETTSDDLKNVEIIGEVSTGVPGPTIAVVEGEFRATTGSFTDKGTAEGDVSIGLDRTTAATVEDGLEENTLGDTINGKIKEGTFNDQRRTTISTAKLEGELRATTSSPIAETESFDLAEGRYGEGGSTGLDGTTTVAMVGDGLEAMGSENTPVDIVNNEIKGGAFNDVRGKTKVTAGVEGEFKTSSSPAGDETVSESTGVNTDKVFSDVNVGSQVNSGPAVAGNGKQSSDGNLDSNIMSTNAVQAKADEEFISEKSALNVYKLEPLNQAAVKATKGKEVVVIYELATAKNTR